jgi:hypothetical protein
MSWGTDWKLAEHIGNLMRPLWKFVGNKLGEKGKMRNLPAPPPTQKEKKLGPL